MNTSDALTLALQNWWYSSLCDLPDVLRRRVEQEFPILWDTLKADRRRKMASQLDYQRDRQGKPGAAPATATRYIAYPIAMDRLKLRLGATPAELAGWIWAGPKNGGIAAYINGDELDPPPRFRYAIGGDSHDYIAPLMACWFDAADIARFVPIDRYVIGAELVERWRARPGLDAMEFIRAKISESRLLDAHPIFGATQGTFPEELDLPPLESGLSRLSEVERIEAEDLDEVTQPAEVNPPALGTREWRKKNASNASNVRHDKPGGSRDKHRQLLAIWATGKYTSKDTCAEQECAALGMAPSTARRALIGASKPSRC